MSDEDVIRQIKINLADDLSFVSIKEIKDKPLVIVGGGPSLKRYSQLIHLHGGDVMALNNSYKYLLENKIKPDYFMLLDGRDENADFVECAKKDVEHFVGVQCSPLVFKKLKEKGVKITSYFTNHPYNVKNISSYKLGDGQYIMLVGGGTVGFKAISLGIVLGYRTFHLYGYDSSYEGDDHHAFEQKMNDGLDVIEVRIQPEGRSYFTTKAMASQASDFSGFLKNAMREYGAEFFMSCDGLLPDLISYETERGQTPLKEREIEKYQMMWELESYRKTSPGEHYVKDAVKVLGMKKGDSVLDFGCGTGRATKKFIDKGILAAGVDFATNALECEVPFIEACLWEDLNLTVKWGYCTDVMEHIPTEKVDDVLRNISTSTTSGCFFNISTVEDNLGIRIGRKLHLTVASADFWKSKLLEFWDTVEMMKSDESAIFITRRNDK